MSRERPAMASPGIGFLNSGEARVAGLSFV